MKKKIKIGLICLLTISVLLVILFYQEYNDALIVISTSTLLIALLTFLSSITSWFKRTIPIQFGFLLNDQNVDKLDIATGDPAKTIILRFHNQGKTTLTGIILDMRFLSPLALSGTGKALSYIPGKTQHGRTSDGSYYLIRHSELELVGDDNLDLRVELNTRGKNPGTYKVIVTVYSTQQEFEFKKAELSLEIK